MMSLHDKNHIFWPALLCLLLLAVSAAAAEVAPVADDEELSTEPLLTEPPSPDESEPLQPQPPHRPKARRAGTPLSLGQPLAPRTYGGGGLLPRSAPPVRHRVREMEIPTEPLAGEETTAAPMPTPNPAPKAHSGNARHYSYSPRNAAGPAPASLPGQTDPELSNAAPLAGRELKTEPLTDGERAGGAVPAYGSDVSFRGELDRNSVHQDESFTLTLDLSAPELKSASAVRFKQPQEFDLINTHNTEARTTVQGRMFQTRTLNYVFLPLQTGTFTLPAAEITYRGRVYRTQPLEVTVEGPRSGFAYQRQFSGRKGRQPKILPAAPDTAAAGKETPATFYANLDQRTAYINQQVTLTVRLRYLSEFGLKVVYLPPPLTGFLSEMLQQTQTEAIVSGTRQKYLERVYRTALFPIQSGVLSISSAQVNFTKWGQNQNQATEPLNLDVKPLPPDPEQKSGEPAAGLVGKYRLAASLLPGRAEVDAPLRLRLTLQGEGNIRAAQDPYLSTDPSLRLQMEGRTEQLVRDNGVVQGQRTFQYLLVPRKPGALALGQARVRYFDPQLQAWRSAAAVLPAVQVEPKPVQEQVVPSTAESAASSARPPLHLRPIHGGQDALRRLDRRSVETLPFWAVQGSGLVLLGLALLVRRWRQQAEADPVALRARRAFGQARLELRAAQGYIRKGAVSRFYDCLARAAAEYLAAKFNVSAAYIVSERLNEYFERYQVPAVFRSRFKTTLTACEYVRYAAVELPTHDMRSLLRDLIEGIEEFERYWRKSGGLRKQAGVGVAVTLQLALLLLIGGLARAGEPELYFLHGNTAFEQGQYETALAEYQRVIALGIADPDVYYNLGNTYVRLGQVGRAILAYEKGLRLAPRDADLRHNLAEAASVAVDAQPEESAVSYRGWVTRAYRLFTANELAWIASVLYFCLLLSIIAWIVAPVRAGWWRRAVLISGGLLILTAGWCAARYLENHWWQRGVIITETAEILGRPYADAEKLYTLHEGTRVRVGREEEAWIEVRFGQNRRGWVARGALGMIE